MRSATQLGRDIGLSAREMNALLREHGYLDGDPGAYDVTEKGKPFAREQDHHRGTGGYSWYNRYWTTRQWDDSVLDAIGADVEEAHRAPECGEVADAISNLELEAEDTSYSELDSGRTSRLAWVCAGVVAAAFVAVAAAPPVRRWVRQTVVPRATTAWRVVTRSEAPESVDSDAGP